MLKFYVWMDKLRIVFMGSPEFAVPSLEKLVLEGYDVVAVYTQPDRPAGRGRALVPPPVKAAAMKMGLRVVQEESLRSPEALAALRSCRPEIIVICAFGQILTQALLDIPPFQCVNVHFSLLPRHRGASPVAAALLAGDAFTGVTVQLVRVKLDTGPVLARAAVAVSPHDSTGTLMAKLAVVGADLLAEALSGWRRGEIKPLPQDLSQSTYFKQIKKEEGQIDWSLPALTLQRRVRAFFPWPGCFTTWRGKQLKINAAEALPDLKSPGSGVVIALAGDDGGLGIGTGEGVLKVLQLQLASRRAVTAAEFLRGQRDFIGAKLPG
jgi:methionyl-tRNA formyltransferase